MRVFRCAKKDQRGLTLTEIMVVLVILGALAGLAIPNYFKTVEQARASEARANLNVIYMAQKIFFLNNNAYWGPGTTIADINTGLNIDLTNQYYTLSVTSVGSGATSTFSAVASRGNAGNKRFTITQTGTITESGTY